MKLAYLFLISALLVLGGCTSGDDDEFSARTGTTTDVTQDGTGDGNGENGDLAVSRIEVEASATTAEVGETVTITATVWLDAEDEEETSAEAGLAVSFVSTGPGTLDAADAETDANGTASVVLEGTDVGTVQVTATADGVESDPTDVIFSLEPAEEDVVSPSRVEAALVGKSSVMVHDPESDRDEVDINLNVYGSDGEVYEGAELSLRVSDGSLSSTTLVSDESGGATVTYSAGTLAGTSVLTVNVADVTYQKEISVGAGDPLFITVEDPSPASIGIRGSGAIETSRIGFFITDTYGNPVSDETEVLFALQPVLAGASISPMSAKTINGSVFPVISSGTKSGALSVVATLVGVDDGEDREVASRRIQIFGGVPAADKFELTFEPGKRIMSGLEMSGLEAQMTVRLADRYGNPPNPGTRISVHCEAGICDTNDDDGLAVDNAGVVSFPFWTGFGNSGTLHHSGQTAAPIDFGYPVGTNHGWDVFTGIPQDGWVNVLAWTTGESAFTDTTGNGVWDGDPASIRKHPGDPFLDRDSSGAFNELTDEFYDFDGNGYSEPPVLGDGEGSHTTLYVWDSLDMVFSGVPIVQVVPDQFWDVDETHRFVPGDDVILVGGPEGTVSPGRIHSYYGAYSTTATEVYVYVSDRNNNPLPRGSTVSYAVKKAPEIELESDTQEFRGGTVRDFVVLAESESDLEESTFARFEFCVTVNVADLADAYEYCFAGRRF